LARDERLADQVAGYRSAEAAASGCVADCLAHLGRFDEARAAAQHELTTFEELDTGWGIADAAWTQGRIEWFAGNLPAAEEGYRELCDLLRDLGNRGVLVYAVLDLAEVLVMQGRDEEVLKQTNDILSQIAPDDAWTHAWWREVRSVPLARLGYLDEAVTLIEEAERWGKGTDLFVSIADTMRSKAEVLKIANRRDDAVVAAREALALYETKEFIPHIGWTQALLDSLTA
jgi:tetratricopeptide (TPR) repeat protein